VLLLASVVYHAHVSGNFKMVLFFRLAVQVLPCYYRCIWQSDTTNVCWGLSQYDCCMLIRYITTCRWCRQIPRLSSSPHSVFSQLDQCLRSLQVTFP